jgi:hypothetical protein
MLTARARRPGPGTARVPGMRWHRRRAERGSVAVVVAIMFQLELAQLQPTGDLLHDRHHQRHHQREYNIHRLLPVILFVRWHTADPLLRHRRGVSFTNSGSGSFTGYVFAPSGQVSMTVSGNNDTGFIEASSVALTNSGSTTVTGTGPTPTAGTKLIG